MAARTKRALDVLKYSTKLTDMMSCCAVLEISTRYSLRCAQQCLEIGLASIIMNTISGLNRSAPHMQLLKNMLSVLANVSYFKPLRSVLVQQVPNMMHVIAVMLMTHKESADVFIRAAALLERLLMDSKNAVAKFELQHAERGTVVKHLDAVHEHIKKKYASEVKAKKPGNIWKATRDCQDAIAKILQLISAPKPATATKK